MLVTAFNGLLAMGMSSKSLTSITSYPCVPEKFLFVLC